MNDQKDPRFDDKMKTLLSILIASSLAISWMTAYIREVVPIAFDSFGNPKTPGGFSSSVLPLILTGISIAAVWNEEVARWVGYSARYLGIPILVLEIALPYLSNFEFSLGGHDSSIFFMIAVLLNEMLAGSGFIFALFLLWILLNLTESAISIPKYGKDSPQAVREEIRLGAFTFLGSLLALMVNFWSFALGVRTGYIAYINLLPSICYIFLFFILASNTRKFFPAWWRRRSEYRS